MRIGLRLLAPYFAVAVFWCILSNAWLAILAYHAQILFWSRHAACDMRRPARVRLLLPALPAALAGPLVYFLLPYMTHTDLSTWLASHGLSRLSLAVMIPYFGVVHPHLEQLHWAPLRESTPAAHIMFAGYHMLVLYSLVAIPWLVLLFTVLMATSFMWQRVTRRSDGLAAPVASQVLADLGIIIAAWLRT